MSKKLTFYFSLFILILGANIFLAFSMYSHAKRVEASQRILAEIDMQKEFPTSSAPFVNGTLETNVVAGDARSKNLKQFFRKYNSALYDHTDHIVAVSDKYQFDYRLLPAIAMQESNLCRYIPENSHNCWGWGIYGDVTTKFDTYDEAIDAVAYGIKTHYIDHGLVTASSIMQKYTPSSNGSWARGVNNVLGWLE